MRRWFACAALFFSLSTHARADEPRASAVELFAHGRSLAAAGKCDEAIPFFLDTLKLEPSIGALLNLAECYEKLHDEPSAYARFREAAVLAREKSDDREAFARDRAAAIAARTPSVTVGSRAPVEARPAVPLLPSPPPVEEKPRDGRAQRTVGIVVTLGGLATLGAGAVLGGLAIVEKDSAVSLSTGASQSAFEAARATAKTFADASTATMIAGAVLAATGLVVWLSAPRANVVVAPIGLGAVLRASF